MHGCGYTKPWGTIWRTERLSAAALSCGVCEGRRRCALIKLGEAVAFNQPSQ